MIFAQAWIILASKMNSCNNDVSDWSEQLCTRRTQCVEPQSAMKKLRGDGHLKRLHKLKFNSVPAVKNIKRLSKSIKSQRHGWDLRVSFWNLHWTAMSDWSSYVPFPSLSCESELGWQGRLACKKCFMQNATNMLFLARWFQLIHSMPSLIYSECVPIDSFEV